MFSKLGTTLKSALTLLHTHYFALTTILFGAFLLRAHNLNYNSPFIDEAMYIVVGKWGFLQKDWLTFDAASWMLGHPYAYTPLTSLAYLSGGIVGSRFLNVIL